MAKTYNCNEVIKTCKYSQNISGAYFLCDYLCRTGKVRKCKPEECDKYEKKDRGIKANGNYE